MGLTVNLQEQRILLVPYSRIMVVSSFPDKIREGDEILTGRSTPGKETRDV